MPTGKRQIGFGVVIPTWAWGAAYGDPDRISRLAEAGAEHFVPRFWTGNPSIPLEDSLEQMESFAETVRPRFT